MIADAISFLAVLGVPAFLLVMLAPALLEWKRPRDAGPRVMLDDVSELPLYSEELFMLTDLERSQGYAGSTNDLSAHMAYLTNLDC